MTVEKVKPKQLLRTITTWAKGNSSQLPVTYLKREKYHAYKVRLVLVLLQSHGLKNWREVFSQSLSEAITMTLLGSLSKDDSNRNDEAREQWSDWLDEEK